MSGLDLGAALRDARSRTLGYVSDLAGDALFGPRRDILNPPLWEIGHIAWFQERWMLRHRLGRPPLRPDGDSLWDSIAIAHDTRWDLPLPSLDGTLHYMQSILDGVLEHLESGPLDEQAEYFARLVLFHEDMHGEALLYSRQTRALPRPEPCDAPPPGGGPLHGDAEIPGGEHLLGATADEPFVFDNEKWAHPVQVAPFALARAAVTQAEFLEFVEADGYRRPELWCEQGRRWLEREGAQAPVYWRREGGEWLRRSFDRWVPLEPHRPVLHVCWYEADAFCRLAGRRLPAEAEWELAAGGGERRRQPWGDAQPTPERARLDAGCLECADVGALAEGDSAHGCRQLWGNVWEWTASPFDPYPGFVPDPYEEYSEPWFGTRMVLRGGAMATRARLLRSSWRNFYEPWRRDVLAGFRTAAV